ncbi:hypothetical protein TrST_g8348 [Triparma strigata]|uniref:ABC transporter domain-containing protein n=1 Tax=Triparma strigata TaxID=1606541 RepID=A0A9W7EK04_9STRA|nr:hypothetical protein TrST_g8348 [Triparma strigata]
MPTMILNIPLLIILVVVMPGCHTFVPFITLPTKSLRRAEASLPNFLGTLPTQPFPVCSHRRATSLFAKKKKKQTPAEAAKLKALEALEALEQPELVSSGGLPFEDDDAPLTGKELKAAMKAAKKAEKKGAVAEVDPISEAAPPAPAPAPAALSFDEDEDDVPLTGKELKAAMKAAKKAKKKEKEADIVEETETEVEAQPVARTPEPVVEAVTEPEPEPEPEFMSAEDELEAIMGGGKKKKNKEPKEKKGKKNKKKKGGEEEEAPEIVAEEKMEEEGLASDTANPLESGKMTLEDKIRNSRPPPKVRVLEGSQPGFVSLGLSDVFVTFRNQEVLKGVSWEVKSGDRVGLVGVNGGGKTTQLKVLNGELEPTTGDVVKSSADLRVAVLRQEFVDELVPERILKEEFMSVFTEENEIMTSLRGSEQELENCDPTNADKMQEILDKMQKLQAKADAKDVSGLESRAEKIMDLMGFDSVDSALPVRSFSGGWKMRIGLGKVLLKDPNILLLDEPTNHLDMESVEWLEDFLRNQNIPMVIVSHDREFLDQVCTKIVDTEGGLATTYDGNYSRFLKQKEAKMKAWQAKYDAQEKKIKEEKAWIQKFKVKQPQAVKQRIARLEKLQNSEDYVAKPPFVGKPFKFRFPPAPRLSDSVAEISGVTHGYPGNPLFTDCEMTIERGDRVALLGPNGSGKSTLLRLVVGTETPEQGTAKLVGMNVVANYFEQNQADVLDMNLTVEQTVAAASDNHSYNELRALMGQFLFKGDTVQKKVLQLSGGEKARLTLCCMMLKPANLLILDEPTNHLDIPAKEMLEEALQNFDGALLVISHDRYFISRIATTICAIEDKTVTMYPGDYKFYMEKNSRVKEKVEGRYVSGVKKIENAVVVEKEEKKNFGGKAAGVSGRLDKGIKNAKRMKT